MFSDNSCTTEGTVIRINPLILHGKNLRRAIQSNPLKSPWSFILWSIRFVLFSPMILFSFNFIHYSSCLKYVFQGEKGQRGRGEWIKVLPKAGSNWHSKRVPKSSPLHSSPGPQRSSGEVKTSSWHLVTWCSFFQLLLGRVPKLNAERTPLFSKVKPPCCSIFFFASGRYQEKGEKRRVFKVTKLKTTSKEPDSLYLTL